MKKSVKKEGKLKSFWQASFADIVLTKFAVFFSTLFLATLFPKIISQEWRWAFLIIAILLAIKPMRSFFGK